LRHISNFMTNYCNQQTKKGLKGFRKERHQIYQKGLERSIWHSGIYFSSHQFLIIVQNGLAIKEYDWVKEFIEDYTQQMDPKDQADLGQFCWALYYFEQAEFNVAQDHLNNVKKSEDFTYSLQYKILLLKIYQAQDDLTENNLETHPINSVVESIKKSLVPSRNKKMSSALRDSYSNFINFFIRILNRKKKILWEIEISTANIEDLKAEIQETKLLHGRHWLLECINNISQLIKS